MNDSIHSSHFGSNLEHLRLKAGLTRKELASRAGLPETMILALEQGIVLPESMETVHALAGALHVSELRFLSLHSDLPFVLYWPQHPPDCEPSLRRQIELECRDFLERLLEAARCVENCILPAHLRVPSETSGPWIDAVQGQFGPHSFTMYAQQQEDPLLLSLVMQACRQKSISLSKAAELLECSLLKVCTLLDDAVMEKAVCADLNQRRRLTGLKRRESFRESAHSARPGPCL